VKKSRLKPSNATPLIVKPRDAEIMLNCSHKRLYELLNAGELESFRDGGSRKITVESINAYIKRKLQSAAAERHRSHGKSIRPDSARP
jgi:excisionase family DNA binding protein